MKIYLNAADAVSDLHKKGYTNDFQVFGNDLLWVQEKMFIRIGEFSIVECHKILEPKNNMDELIVFGVVAHGHNIKGILVNHYKSYTGTTPPVIKKKLTELGILAGMNAIS